MRVLFFAQLKDVTHRGEMDLPVDEVDAETLWQHLVGAYPALGRFRGSVRLAKNSEYVGPDARFLPTDEVALIPPVSGG